MKVSLAGQWIQVGANVGILAGLILVGVQINQNTDAVKAQMNEAASNSLLQYEYTIMGENPAVVWAKSMQAPTELSLAEQKIMDSYIYTQVERWRHSYYSGKRGHVEEDQWRRFAEADAAYILGNPYGRAWWKRFNEEAPERSLPPEMADLINKQLRAFPNGTLDYFSRIQGYVEQ